MSQTIAEYEKDYSWHQKLRNTWARYSHHTGFKRALYTILGALTLATLHKIAKKIDIAGHWKMKKPALVAAIAKHRKKAVYALIGLGVLYGSIKFLRSYSGKKLKSQLLTDLAPDSLQQAAAKRQRRKIQKK